MKKYYYYLYSSYFIYHSLSLFLEIDFQFEIFIFIHFLVRKEYDGYIPKEYIQSCYDTDINYHQIIVNLNYFFNKLVDSIIIFIRHLVVNLI